MGSPAGEQRLPDACGCAHDLAAVAGLLRQALAVIEGPRTYEQGISEWAQQVRDHRRNQHPHERVGAGGGPGAPRAPFTDPRGAA